MKGFIAKAALTEFLEKVWLASGNKISRMKVQYAGDSAGIQFERTRRGLFATIRLPAIYDAADVQQSYFNDLTGFALHELGHAWFTDNEPWDDAVREHGKVLGGIVNGLEDCRAELKVIRAGYAENAGALFAQLCNNVFAKSFDNTMIENVAAVIAVEGRRLNGYDLLVPNSFDTSPWREEIATALRDLPSCKNTADVVIVAIELWQKIRQRKEACMVLH